jgi:hypothetical protein
MFKLFHHDLGPLGPLLLVMLALGAMWLGYRFSRPSNNQLSIRRPALAPGSAFCVKCCAVAGQKFTIRAILNGPAGESAIVVSVWFIAVGDRAPIRDGISGRT